MDTVGNRILKTLLLVIWVIALVNAAAEIWFLYWQYQWLDIPMHFIGGVWLGLLGLWLWNHTAYLSRFRAQFRISNILIVFVFGIAIGLVWEAFEYIVWKYSGKPFPLEYATDSTLDLFMDTLGAYASLFVYKLLSRTSASTITP